MLHFGGCIMTRRMIWNYEFVCFFHASVERMMYIIFYVHILLYTVTLNVEHFNPRFSSTLVA